MLRRVDIRSFQCHSQRQVVLENITTLIGESDKGKSAILRAIKWACTNKPSGDSFITHGEEEVCVKLFLEEDKITRRKSKKLNTYSLNKKKYKSFNQGVPSEISDLLNTGDINFQGQHDPPFWFYLSPGEVSKEINQIVNLDLMDRVLANIATELRSSHVVEKVDTDRLQTAREKEKELAWVEEASMGLTRIEELENRVKLRKSNIHNLDSLILSARELEDTMQASHGVILLGNSIDIVGGNICNLDVKIKCLKILATGIEEACRRAEIIEVELTHSEEELAKIMKGKCPVCQKDI